jgi:hypothetical protein
MSSDEPPDATTGGNENNNSPKIGDELRATAIRSHIYLRTAMVCLLVALGVGVLYQTWAQDFHLLSSVSAYYHTPAQTVFVGSLIGFGACLIALRGRTDSEDLFLNLAGIFALVVAVVPTSRSPDYRSAERLCAEAQGEYPGPTDGSIDCKSVNALREAARANIDNSMTTLLGVALLGLLATVVFVVLQRTKDKEATTWWGFVVGAAVVLAIAVAYLAVPDWYANWAHFIAACGLMACIAVVAMLNRKRQVGYAWTAVAIVVAAVAGLALMVANAITLFWVEIVVAFLFLVYWAGQTLEQLQLYRRPADKASAGA